MLENQHLFSEMYERVLLGKRSMAPFHLNCEVTKKQVCRCAFANLPLSELDKVLYRNTGPGNQQASKRQRLSQVLPEDVAYDMHLYFQGYPAGM